MDKMREDILARGEDPSLFPVLNSKPELFRDLLWIWEGFMVLSSARQIGMNGPQPVSMSEILAYTTYEGISDSTDKEDFLYHVQNMDRVFLADFRARNPSTPSSGTKPKGLGA